MRVPVRTLDRYAEETGLIPDAIKIDVEGAEVQVLLGASELLRRHRPVLLIGVHPFWWPPGQDPAALESTLSEAGYGATRLDGSPTTLRDYEDVLCRPAPDGPRSGVSADAKGLSK